MNESIPIRTVRVVQKSFLGKQQIISYSLIVHAFNYCHSPSWPRSWQLVIGINVGCLNGNTQDGTQLNELLSQFIVIAVGEIKQIVMSVSSFFLITTKASLLLKR